MWQRSKENRRDRFESVDSGGPDRAWFRHDYAPQRAHSRRGKAILIETLHKRARAVVAGLSPRTLLETGAMVGGIGSLALALGVTVAQATLVPVARTAAELRMIVARAGFEAAVCPDGWAARHAALLDLSEAQVTAWYLRESMELSDREVIGAVGVFLENPKDFRGIEGAALTRNQILLCIAESRRLTTPDMDLVHPDLRGA
jgi:hypothetical protein